LEQKVNESGTNQERGKNVTVNHKTRQRQNKIVKESKQQHVSLVTKSPQRQNKIERESKRRIVKTTTREKLKVR